jgi:predicted RNA polymerase sigma factor
VIELNRTVAVSLAFGAAAGLEVVDRLNHDPALAASHRLPSLRGDLLFKLGRLVEARGEFERAALAQNTREREILLPREAECKE